MSLNEGEVTVTLGRDTYVLKQTLKTFTGLNALYNGFHPLQLRLMNQDADAIIAVVKVGAGLQGRDAELLPRRLYAAGINKEILRPLIEYVNMAANGGKPVVEDQITEPVEDDAGNV